MNLFNDRVSTLEFASVIHADLIVLGPEATSSQSSFRPNFGSRGCVLDPHAFEVYIARGKDAASNAASINCEVGHAEPCRSSANLTGCWPYDGLRIPTRMPAYFGGFARSPFRLRANSSLSLPPLAVPPHGYAFISCGLINFEYGRFAAVTRRVSVSRNRYWFSRLLNRNSNSAKYASRCFLESWW